MTRRLSSALTLESLADAVPAARTGSSWSPTTAATRRGGGSRRGVEVVETVGNTEKKAGALNQQLGSAAARRSSRATS